MTASTGGIAAIGLCPIPRRDVGEADRELQRQVGFGSYQTAWAWLPKIRKAIGHGPIPRRDVGAADRVRPDRPKLRERVAADETYLGGAKPGRPGRGAAGKARGRRLRRARLPDAGATSREGFLAANVAKPAAVATDGWTGYAGLAAEGYRHEPVKLGTSWGDAALRLPAIHLVFGRAKRWLPVSSADIPPGDRAKPDGSHHGAVGKKHLPADLDDYVFRFNRRTARSISHRFARLIEQAVATKPVTYRAIVATPAPA